MKNIILLIVVIFIWGTKIEQVSSRSGIVILPNGKEIKAKVVFSLKDQETGLSGVKDYEFTENQGLLFFNRSDEERVIWMPATYFNLDVIYLSKEFKVVKVIRDLQHYTGRDPKKTPKAPPVTSRHILEIKAGTSLSETISEGDILTWKGDITELETAASKFKVSIFSFIYFEYGR